MYPHTVFKLLFSRSQTASTKMLSRSALRVQAASKPVGKSASVKVAVGKSASVKVQKAAPAPAPAKKATAPQDKTALSILAKVESLKLLSQIEKAGLLTKLEKAGFSLSKIEEAGLLSFAEKSGVLTLIADKNTPGLLNTTGLALLAAAVALVVAVPDDSTAAVVLQGFGGISLALGGVAALTGGSTLASFQKL